MMRALLVFLCFCLASCAQLPLENEGLFSYGGTPASSTNMVADTQLASLLPASLSPKQRYLQLQSEVLERPLSTGNHVKLLVDGPSTHAAQLRAIARAQDHIHINMYLLTDDEIGNRYANALEKRANAGVVVRLVFDGLGGLGAGNKFLKRLRTAGVKIREFHTLNPVKDPRIWRINRRNHRKLIVVDGKLAFTGGINITDDYLHAPDTSTNEQANKASGWRDTHLRISGPAVHRFQALFLNTWRYLGGKARDPKRYFPKLAKQGKANVHVVVNEGADLIRITTGFGEELLRWLAQQEPSREHDIYRSYLNAINAAEHRIWITQAYFAPNSQFLNALRKARERGVDVRLLLPGSSDVGVLLHASRHYYQRLLDAGVRIYEYQGAMIHAKTAVVDGVWTTIGSSNLDFRSFLHNDEANAIAVDRQLGLQMELMFLNDLNSATTIEPETWSQRPLEQQLKEQSAVALKYWL